MAYMKKMREFIGKEESEDDTGREIVGDEATAGEQGIDGSSRGRQRVELRLPGQGSAKERERLTGAGGGLEEGVDGGRAVREARLLKRGQDLAHESQLRGVRLVGELHVNAADLELVQGGSGSGRGRGKGGVRHGDD